ncbi:MAG: hypothetical protein AAGJ87_07075, partial [Pseudomonadota bacterium]
MSADGRTVVTRLKKAWGESPFYQLQLRGPAPDRFYLSPKDPRAPSADIGEMLLRGRLTVGAHSLDGEGDLASLWDIAIEAPAANAYLQEHAWLRHLTALGDEGCAAAKSIVAAW